MIRQQTVCADTRRGQEKEETYEKSMDETSAVGNAGTAMASTVLVGIPSQAAEEAGIPYDEQGNYNVQIPHVMVNQVYGGSDDGYASHSFIELYNPCDTAVDLNGWELQYQSSPDGEEDGWQELTLTGTIPAGAIIWCAAV